MRPTIDTPVTNFARTVFSNFSGVPHGITYLGEIYPTVEHAFQAAKTESPIERRKVQTASSAAKAKALGRKVALRLDWEEVKIEVMRGFLRQKFFPGTEEARVLMLTTGDLIEVNTWGDRFWGESPRGVGENHLGKLLMEIRAELKGS